MELKPVLLRQWDTARALLDHHLAGLTTEECLWRPAAVGLHVHQDDDGRWRADWPAHEGYDLGPPSIAWTSWHLGMWLSMALDHAFGDGTLTKDDVAWPGDDVAGWITDLADRWRREVEAVPEPEWRLAERVRWPFRDRPFADLVAWSTVELTKNAAELGQGRFLYGVRDRAAGVRPSVTLTMHAARQTGDGP